MVWITRAASLLLSFLLLGCVSFKSDTSLPATVIASPNFDMRHPTMVVIHYTSNVDADQSLETLTSPIRKVSAHYLIDAQGRLYQLVPENQRAWHAGQSYWAGNSDINSTSIGIELDNNGREPYGDAQINALVLLINDIQARHRIRPMNIVGHSDVAPGRKIDPGPYFPWSRLAKSGIGLWCPDSSTTRVKEGSQLNELLLGLGYDPKTPEKSRAAFRSHYLLDGNGAISGDDAEELKVAQCLLDQITSRNSAPTSQNDSSYTPFTIDNE